MFYTFYRLNDMLTGITQGIQFLLQHAFGVPALGVNTDDQARRFVNLVDEFYDRSVKLVLAAESPLLELYSGGHLEFEFQRTLSRLQEMQSLEYLAREHKP